MMELFQNFIIIIGDIGEGNPGSFRDRFVEEFHQVIEALSNLSNICDLFKFKDILCFQNYFWNGIESLYVIRE